MVFVAEKGLVFVIEIKTKRMKITKSSFNKSNGYYLFHWSAKMKAFVLEFLMKYFEIIWVTSCFEDKFQKNQNHIWLEVKNQ